jgi:hypothetical protein
MAAHSSDAAIEVLLTSPILLLLRHMGSGFLSNQEQSI